MGKKFIIRIEVEGGVPEATIIDSDGKRATLTGLVLFGSEKGTDISHAFAWGYPTDAAYALGEGLARAVDGGDPYYRDFYKAMLMQMVQRTRTDPNRQVITIEELEARWKTNPANPECQGRNACACSEEDSGKSAAADDNTDLPKDPKDWN